MLCPKCQHTNRPNAKFCARCRARLQPVCPACGAEVASDDRFCSECGADLPMAGAVERRQVGDLQQHLVAVEQTLPTTLREQLFVQEDGENRILTILFADLSGSVQTTAQLHPEEAAERVNAVFKVMVDAILKYEGRINRLLGDEVLAFFGTPQAHENDPERAILAALEIRAGVQRLGLNITAGINTGEVYLGGIGTAEHQEWTAMGTGVEPPEIHKIVT